MFLGAVLHVGQHEIACEQHHPKVNRITPADITTSTAANAIIIELLFQIFSIIPYLIRNEILLWLSKHLAAAFR
ncbi:MAG: hypothetical protein ACYTEQ_03115 [Planctomycetota bacterium]